MLAVTSSRRPDAAGTRGRQSGGTHQGVPAEPAWADSVALGLDASRGQVPRDAYEGIADHFASLLALGRRTGERVEQRWDGAGGVDAPGFAGVGREPDRVVSDPVGYAYGTRGAANQGGAGAVGAGQLPRPRRFAMSSSDSTPMTLAPTATPGEGVYPTGPSVPVPTAAGASAQEPQGDEGVEPSSVGDSGADVPEWVIPAAGGAAAAILAVLLVCEYTEPGPHGLGAG